SYKFQLETPRPEGRLWVTALPRGAFISAIRHAGTHSVIELGSALAPAPGKVKVVFHRRCVGVADAEGDHAGAFEAGSSAELTTRVPGAFVVLWEQPKSTEGRAA